MPWIILEDLRAAKIALNIECVNIRKQLILMANDFVLMNRPSMTIR
jgi:hypothetical protein